MIVVTIGKIETGISGLDTMLRGGFPEGRMILLMGGPGTGKTIFCSQFLHHGSANQDEKTVYISLDETKPHYLKEMSTLGWDFQKLEQDRKFTFIDASSIRRIPERSNVSGSDVAGKDLARATLIDNIFTIFDGTRSTSIERFVGDLGAQRVVLDSISGLLFRFAKAWEKRQAILDIIEALYNTGATCMITTEAKSMGEERQVQPEEYLCHGALFLQTLATGDRAVRILKMRGTDVDSVPRPYRIGETGIEVHPDRTIYQT